MGEMRGLSLISVSPRERQIFWAVRVVLSKNVATVFPEWISMWAAARAYTRKRKLKVGKTTAWLTRHVLLSVKTTLNTYPAS